MYRLYITVNNKTFLLTLKSILEWLKEVVYVAVNYTIDGNFVLEFLKIMNLYSRWNEFLYYVLWVFLSKEKINIVMLIDNVIVNSSQSEYFIERHKR